MPQRVNSGRPYKGKYNIGLYTLDDGLIAAIFTNTYEMAIWILEKEDPTSDDLKRVSKRLYKANKKRGLIVVKSTKYIVHLIPL